jgi:hypothetical protein
MSKIKMTKELHRQSKNIGNKAIDLIKSEVEKLFEDPIEQYVFAHAIIANMYQADQVVMSEIGLKVTMKYEDD